MQTYHSREKVKARKVTDKDGETVITSNGAMYAAKGSFIVHKENAGTDAMTGEDTTVTVVSVWSADAFNAAYASAPGRGGGESRRARASASKRASSASQKGSTRKTAASKSTAAERVKGRARK